jgi:hypothetical protein
MVCPLCVRAYACTCAYTYMSALRTYAYTFAQCMRLVCGDARRVTCCILERFMCVPCTKDATACLMQHASSRSHAHTLVKPFLLTESPRGVAASAGGPCRLPLCPPASPLSPCISPFPVKEARAIEVVDTSLDSKVICCVRVIQRSYVACMCACALAHARVCVCVYVCVPRTSFLLHTLTLTRKRARTHTNTDAHSSTQPTRYTLPATPYPLPATRYAHHLAALAHSRGAALAPGLGRILKKSAFESAQQHHDPSGAVSLR